MVSLKDKKIHIRNKKSNDINNYCFEGRDVKEAVLEFDDYINYSNEDGSVEEFKLEIYEKIREIFGDFEDDI